MSIANIRLTADSRQVRSATKDLRVLQDQGASTERAVAGLRNAFIALGGAAVLGNAIKTTADFSQAVANLAAVTGTAGKDLQFYRDQAAEIGRTTTLSAAQAVEAYQLIASASPQLLKNAEALNAVTREAVVLAEATGQDLPTAAKALGSALNQFQLDAGRAGEVINILAASSQLGTAQVSSVTEALKNAGPAAQALNIDLAETVAGIQALATAGREGADAGTGLRQVLLRLERTGDSALQPSLVGINAALVELESRNLSNTQLMKLFGDEAFSAATAIIGQRETLEELNRTLRGTSTAYEQASTRTDTFNADLKALGSALEGLQIEALSNDVDGLGRNLTQLATGGVNTLTENLDHVAQVAGVIATIFAGRLAASAAASAGAFLTAQIQAARYTATIGALVGMSKTAIASQTALAVATRGAGAAMAFLGGPVGLVVTALGAATIAYSAFSDETEDNTEKLKANTEAMGENLTLLERYREGRDKVIEANVSGGSASQLQVELDATLNTINALQARLDRLNERGASAARIADVSEKLREQQVEAEALREALKKANAQEDLAGKAQAAEAYEKITQRINDEIFALRKGEQAAEIRIAQRRAGVDAASEEGQAITNLIKQRDGLTEAERKAAEAVREQERAYDSFVQRLEKASQAEQDAAQAKKENFESLKQSIILQRDQIALDSEQFELRRNIMALGDDATDSQIEQITNLTLQMQALRNEAELLGPSLSSTFMDIGSSAISSFSDELAESILLGESFEDSLKNITSTILTGLLSAVIEYGTRKTAVYALDAMGFGAAEATKTAAVTAGIATQTAAATGAIGTLTAAQAASGATIAASMAPAAAATSIATAGAAPAAAAPIALSSIGTIIAALAGGLVLGSVVGGRRQGGQMLGGNQYMVGEDGPEVVTMGGRANVTPFNQLMQQAGQGGTTNNSQSTQANITFTMPEGNADFRNRVAQNRDLIYNVVQQALNDRGQRLGGRK